jgi:RNA polymerase sigma factor (sigma-70 family)
VSEKTWRKESLIQSDAKLIREVRAGRMDAYGQLWSRHSAAGLVVARSVTTSLDPDDVVSEAFAKILAAFQRGKGPEGAFRPYLYTTIRNVAATWGSRRREYTTSDGVEFEIEDPRFSEENSLAIVDHDLSVRAFHSLPARWQEVLWYDEIEGMPPSEIAPILGIKTTAVSVLAYRAREGLRRAWIKAHISTVPDDSECRWFYDHLGAYGRRSLRPNDLTRFENHRTDDARCKVIAEEVNHVGSKLKFVLLPPILGTGAATAWLQFRDAPSAQASVLRPRGLRSAGPSKSVAIAVAGAAVLAVGAMVAAVAVQPPVASTTVRAAAPNHGTDGGSHAASPLPPSNALRAHAASPPLLSKALPAHTVAPGAVAPLAGQRSIPQPPALLALGSAWHSPASSPVGVTTPRVAISPVTPANGLPATPGSAPSTTDAGLPPLGTDPVGTDSPQILEAPTVVTVNDDGGLLYPILEGTARPGAIITISQALAEDVTVTVDEEGNWSTTPLVAAPSGDSTFSVTQTVNNTESPATSVTVTLQAPTFAGTSGPLEDGSVAMPLTGAPDSHVVVEVDGASVLTVDLDDSGAGVAHIPITPGNNGPYEVAAHYEAAPRLGPESLQWYLTIRPAA